MTVRPYQQHTPVIASTAWIDPSAVVIGQVTLGEHVSVWPQVTIRGDVNTISIGDGSNIQDGAVLHCTHDGPFTTGGSALAIGSRVTVGHQACLHGCTIGDDVLIGIGAIVLDGAVIEDCVMVGAGALVPPGKRLESGHLYVGSPVKQARPLSDTERAALKYSAEHYTRLAAGHHQALSEQGKGSD